jgi:UDP-N-acetylglucosamine--dolichyl-phosphate N-acetylglucosaminephosphotransferase
VTLFFTKELIIFLHKAGIKVKDLNKQDEPEIPLSGGVAVLAGYFFGLMFFIFNMTFNIITPALKIFQQNLTSIFASVISVILVTFIGFIDDLSVRLAKEHIYIGLKQWHKPMLTLIAATPLIVINAGESVMYFPFIQQIHLGSLYPLIIIPVAFVGASNMVNLLEGYNGLAATMALAYLPMLAAFGLKYDRPIGAMLALIALGCVFAFYLYNRYPSRIFPGDSLTYFLGGILASIAIVGDMEKPTLIVSIPFFIEFILKARGKFQKQSYGYFKDGKIHCRYDKLYSIPHIFALSGKFTEKQIVLFHFFIALFFSSFIWIF